MGRKKLVSDEQLLEVARQAFVEQGFAASTREIARRAGVSEAVLFQRYATKADLFFAAMVPPLFDLRTCLPQPGTDVPGQEVIRRLFRGLLEYFRTAAPMIVQLVARREFQFEEFALAHPQNTLVTSRTVLIQALEDLRTAGQFGADPRWAGLAIFMTAHSIALFEQLGAHGGRFTDEMIDGTVDALWAGFRVEKG